MLDKIAQHHLQRLRTATTNRVSRGELSRWISENTRLNNKPYSFERHWYQEQLLNDTSSDICVVKPAQIGASELSLRWVLALVMTTPDVMRVGYTFPTYSAATNFARTRFANIIDGCPVAKSAMGTSDIDTVDLKTFGENREIHFRGAAVGNAAISTTLDMLVHDELSFSDPEIIATYHSRVQASKYKWRIVFSTPTFPGDAITTEFQNSRRHYNMCKCNHCNHVFYPDYYRDVKIPGYTKDLSEITKESLHRIKWESAALLCPKCGRAPDLERKSRFWAVENSDETHVMAGYKLSPFDLPSVVTAAALVRGSANYGNKTLFKQFALGEPSQDAENGLTDEDMEKAGVELGTNPFGHCVMGIDVGNVSWFTIGGVTPDGKFGIVHMEKVPLANFRERYWALKAQYRVSIAVCDSMPFLDLVMSLCAEDQNFFGALYSTQQGLDFFQVRVREPDADKAQGSLRQVNIARSQLFDKMLSEVRAGRMWFKRTDLWQTFKEHACDMKRASATLRNGEMSSLWVKSAKGADHSWHAAAYCFVASQMRGLVHNHAPLEIFGVRKFKLKN